MSHPTSVAFVLALLAQPRNKHSNAVLLGDCGAVHGMDLGAGVLLNHHRHSNLVAHPLEASKQ